MTKLDVEELRRHAPELMRAQGWDAHMFPIRPPKDRTELLRRLLTRYPVLNPSEPGAVFAWLRQHATADVANSVGLPWP